MTTDTPRVQHSMIGKAIARLFEVVIMAFCYGLVFVIYVATPCAAALLGLYMIVRFVRWAWQ